MTDRREMTISEAEAWRAGYEAARRQAVLLAEETITPWSIAAAVIAAIARMEPEAER